MNNSISNLLYNNKYGHTMESDNWYESYRNFQRIRKYIPLINPQQNDTILEIGCNQGVFLKVVQQHCPTAIGIDINADIVTELNNSTISQMSATALKFSSNKFNKIYAFEVIEHILDTKLVFSEVNRVLVSGGEFTFSFPVEIIRGQSALRDAWIAHKNLMYARKLHVHKFSPKKINQITNNLGFITLFSQIMWTPSPSYVMKIQKNNLTK